MRRLPAGAVVLLGALLVCSPAQGASPTEQLRGFFGAASRILDPESGEGAEARLSAIRAIARELIDVRAAAQLSLGASWNARTAAERDEFVPLFAELLERALIGGIAGKIRLPDGLQVRYVAESVEGSMATVWTTIASRSGIDLPFTYRMIERAGRWAIRDVVIDGVSVAANYRAQFIRVIQSSSYQELVRQMRARVPEAMPLAPDAPSPESSASAGAESSSPGSDARMRLDLEVTLIARALPDSTPRDGGRAAPAASAEPDPTPRGDGAELLGPAEPPEPTASPALPAPASSPTPAAAPVAPPTTPTPRAALWAAPAAPPGPVPRPATRAVPRPTPPSPALQPAAAVVAAPLPVSASHGPAYWVQVGAFRSPEAARRLAALLAEEEPAPSRFVVESWAADVLLTRVRVGPFPDRWEAAAAAREMEARGHKPFIAAERE